MTAIQVSLSADVFPMTPGYFFKCIECDKEFVDRPDNHNLVRCPHCKSGFNSSYALKVSTTSPATVSEPQRRDAREPGSSHVPGVLNPVHPVHPVHSDCTAAFWLERWADLTRSNLASLRDWIDSHRDELTLDAVMQALERIDEVRRTITLSGLCETPIVAIGHNRDYRRSKK